jgi:hypothetical protein
MLQPASRRRVTHVTRAFGQRNLHFDLRERYPCQECEDGSQIPAITIRIVVMARGTLGRLLKGFRSIEIFLDSDNRLGLCPNN